ncbi:MAG TPA: hypothetical protein VGP25_21055 [Gemmatimonadaceae bacterium]|jgi:hypothetical protein|nr:hypothetical protein [Gemmatimonadaceae bacterium]
MQRIHGLLIASSATLPGLPHVAATRPADVHLELTERALESPRSPLRPLYQTQIDPWDPSDPTLTVALDSRGIVCFRYSDGTAIDVSLDRGAARITARIAPGQILEDLTTYLYGAVLGFVLRTRGVLAMHASCVADDEGAILLVGHSGAGKSTTAASLHRGGWRVLSDDLTALSAPAPSGGPWLAHSAFSHVRLWPTSEPIVLGAAGVLGRITPSWDKLRYPLDAGSFGDDGVPVRGIFVIHPREDSDDAPRASDDEAAPQRLLTLATMTYANYLHDARTRAIELQQLGGLLRDVPVRTLVAHRDPTRIGALCELIEREARAMRAAGSLAAR